MAAPMTAAQLQIANAQNSDLLSLPQELIDNIIDEATTPRASFFIDNTAIGRERKLPSIVYVCSKLRRDSSKFIAKNIKYILWHPPVEDPTVQEAHVERWKKAIARADTGAPYKLHVIPEASGLDIETAQVLAKMLAIDYDLPESCIRVDAQAGTPDWCWVNALGETEKVIG